MDKYNSEEERWAALPQNVKDSAQAQCDAIFGRYPHLRFYAEIGRKLRARRKILGLSQEVLASMVEMPRSALANIEAGRQSLLVHQLYDLAAVLNCLPSDLSPKVRIRI